MRTFAQKLKNIYFLSFIIPIILLLGIFVARGIFPFGNNSFMFSDMYHQYVPFLTEFWRKLHGGESLAFSWNAGLGSNFFAIYAYYLASPINWLCFFVPEAFLMEFMTYFIVIKIGLCSLTFAYYLSKRFGTKDFRIVWFAVFYAMSGYIAAYNWNHMWLDCLWLAPLIILGLEELVKNGKCRLYCLTLAASIFTNYYLSILICIFLVLYFFLQLFTNGLSIRQKGRAVINFAVSSLLSGGMAAVLLIPVMHAMFQTDFHANSFPKEIEVYFNALEMLARHVVMLPAERGLAHWPNIYCGVLAFVLIPIYLFHKKISLKQKIGNFLLLAFMLLSFAVNILNFIWHGFNYPNSLPARQSFLYIFVILTMCFEAVYRDEENGRWNRVAGAICGALLLVAIGVFVTTDGVTVSVMTSTWIFLVGYFVLWLLFHKGIGAKIFKAKPSEKLTKLGVFAVLLLVLVEATLNMEHTSLVAVQRNYYMNKKADYQALAAIADEETTGFYRMDSLVQMTKNDGTLAGYQSASVFSSAVNGAVEDYYDRLGMGGSKVAYYYSGATPFTAALLSVQYTVSDSEEMDKTIYEPVAEHGSLYLYRNKYTLPLGFALTAQLKESFEKDLAADIANPLVTQNAIVEDLYEGESLFINLDSEEVDKLDSEVTITTKQAGHIYALVSKDPEGKVFFEQGEESKELKNYSKKNLLDLGWFDKGEEFKIDAEKEETLFIRFYRLNPEPLEDIMDKLGEQPLTIQSYTETELNGTINLKEDGYLVMSIPAESGWSVLVDGSKTEYEKFAETMIAVPLTAGEHMVQLKYSIHGVGVGLGVSLASVLLFGLIYLRKKKGSGKEQIKCEEM